MKMPRSPALYIVLPHCTQPPHPTRLSIATPLPSSEIIRPFSESLIKDRVLGIIALPPSLTIPFAYAFPFASPNMYIAVGSLDLTILSGYASMPK